MICKVCGAEIPDNSLECEFCGCKFDGGEEIIEETDDETKVINTDKINSLSSENDDEDDGLEKPDEIYDENEKKRQEQIKKMMEDKKRQLSDIERRRNEKKRRQQRNKIMLIAVICALALAAAGIGAYYIASNVNTEAPKPTATPFDTASAVVTQPPMPTVTPLADTPSASPYTEAGTSESNTTAQSGASTAKSSSNNNSSGSSSGGSSSGSNKTNSGSSSNNNSSGSSSGSSSSSASSSNGSSSVSVSNSGISSSNLLSQLSTGGEVIYNSDTGKYIMTFVSNGTRYYANVSPGSTTAQIQNKPYTITAEPTSQTYNGNTIYEITDMTNYEGDYLLADSGTKLLSESDIKGMSKYDLALARNEIYARHGRKFQTAEYNSYFTGKSWYKINPNYNYSDDNSNLNDIEAKNVEFLLNAERR